MRKGGRAGFAIRGTDPRPRRPWVMGDEDSARSSRAWQEGAGRVWRGSWNDAPGHQAARNPPAPRAGRAAISVLIKALSPRPRDPPPPLLSPHRNKVSNTPRSSQAHPAAPRAPQPGDARGMGLGLAL